ncbi:transposase [Piscinibacter aquaticus]|uniref:Transposase n=1 Tax=Piscinibacter aquaticus TaxID=392597 RepID=A0A5C6TN90_9BURK|nr:transposase [Piscinibacter aquaticus]
MSAISERTGHDCKTARKYIRQGLVAPKYKPRAPRAMLLEPFESHLRERVAACPELTGTRLLRENREPGYRGGKTAMYDFLREVRPPVVPAFQARFETPAGRPAQVDVAEFRVEFANEPGLECKVWLLAMLLGQSRLTVGAVRDAPGPAHRLALPHGGLRALRWRNARDRVRPQEDRGAGRAGRGQAHRLG